MVSIATEEYGLTVGLTDNESARLRDAHEFVRPVYAGKRLRTGQDALEFSEQVTLVLAQLSSDVDTRIAALLFQLHVFDPDWQATIEKHFGHELAEFVSGIQRLMRLHEMTFGQQEPGTQQDTARTRSSQQAAAAQVEALRKMLLAMAADNRAVATRSVPERSTYASACGPPTQMANSPPTWVSVTSAPRDRLWNTMSSEPSKASSRTAPPR